MLRPVIFIGCGGSGQKAVRYVRDAVRRHLEHMEWEGDFPSAWQFIGIDTLTFQEDASIPYLPNNDYKSVSLDFKTYQDLNQAVEAQFGPNRNAAAFKDLRGWRARPDQVTVPLEDGAGKLRAVGRMAGVLALQDSVRKRIQYAFTQTTAGGPQLAEVSRHLGVTVPPGSPVPSPLTIVMGSMAGGTGAGIMLDVIDLVRRTDSAGAFPVLVAFTPDIFGSDADNLMAANAAAFMSEMMSAYWDDENTDSALIPSNVAVHTRGPHSVFLIGRKSIDGLDLMNSKNVYRAVGEALAAVTTSSAVQTQFHNFITVNWAAEKRDNAGGFGFSSSRLAAVASSFGSATVSIGRDRFRDYLRALLHRSTIEHLVNGFTPVANSLLGQDSARTTAPHAKIKELSRRNLDGFMIACALQEVKNGGSRMVSDRFVSNDIMRVKLAEVSNGIKRQLPAQQQSAGAWQQQILALSTQEKVGLLREVDGVLRDQIRDWGSDVFERVLRATTEYSAMLSIPVVLSLLEETRAQVLQASTMLRDEAREERNDALQKENDSRRHLGGAGKAALGQTAGAVQQTITDAAKAACLEWSAAVKERLSVALEAVATEMMSRVEAAAKQALSRLESLTVKQDGEEAVIAGWPQNDGVVPTSFEPSPVEFFLEEHTTWPARAHELVGQSLGDRQGLPIDVIEAARLLIIRGGFGGDGNNSTEIPPLFWGDEAMGKPAWEPGHTAVVKAHDDLAGMIARIDAWIMRPSTTLRSNLTEGLSSYLMPSRDNVAIPDHMPRLAKFRQQLKMALMQSRPLIEIDRTMNSTVHPHPLSYKLNIQGFPFGVGHPARAETEQIIQGFLDSPDPVDHVFTTGDAESVLITNFLERPVNPSVVTSFTQPLSAAVSSFDADYLKTSFWQWRRARILENFIPLPDVVRVAAIRGFAVARALGTVTADPTGQNMISNVDGVHNFPRHLLTETDRTNILPALLEAMILTFADAPTKQGRAFSAYGAMVGYGTGGGMQDGFEISGDIAKILESGDYGMIQVVDRQRADALAKDVARPVDRVKNAISYIDANLIHFDALELRPLDPTSWREESGAVKPVDTLTLELLADMRRAYTQVREALVRFETAISGGHSDGPV